MHDPDDETFRDVDNDEFYELFECAPITTGRTIMHRRGFHPLRPEEVPENEITGRLWELLHHLALRNFFVTQTDHLSDTELYAELWHKALREKSLLPDERTRYGYWMHDILGSYGTEECNLQLAIYATDAERTRHTEQFPNWPLPEKRERLTRRDWRLPRAPF